VEDGHIIYENAPAEVDAATIAYYNGNSNVSSGSNRRKNSSVNASAERLPSSRWSPATASTTITVAEDDDSSSSKHQVIILLLLLLLMLFDILSRLFIEYTGKQTIGWPYTYGLIISKMSLIFKNNRFKIKIGNLFFLK